MMEFKDALEYCIREINKEPRFVMELVRGYMRERRIPDNERVEVIKLIGGVLKFLGEKKGFGKIDLWTDHWEGSIIWKPYAIWFNANFVSPEDKEVQKKLKLVDSISKIGKECSKMYERAVYRAVRKFFSDAYLTDYNDPIKPDVVVERDGFKLGVEASARFENPLDRHYCLTKLLRANAFNFTHLLFVAPAFADSGVEVIKNWRDELRVAEIVKLRDVGYLVYPLGRGRWAGFVLFRKYKYYEKWFRGVYRKVRVMRAKEFEEGLVNYLERVFKVWRLI